MLSKVKHSKLQCLEDTVDTQNCVLCVHRQDLKNKFELMTFESQNGNYRFFKLHNPSPLHKYREYCISSSSFVLKRRQ